MWLFIMTYDHVISAGCDIFCTLVMVANILKNRKRIDKLDKDVCSITGQRKEDK